MRDSGGEGMTTGEAGAIKRKHPNVGGKGKGKIERRGHQSLGEPRCPMVKRT